MKAHELIALLQLAPPDADVVLFDEGGLNVNHAKRAEACDIKYYRHDRPINDNGYTIVGYTIATAPASWEKVPDALEGQWLETEMGGRPAVLIY